MLSEKQIDIIINALKPYQPDLIGIFGSVARGENTSGSDIDILYRLKDTVNLFTLLAIKDDLERKLHKKVDLVSEKYANPRLKPYILNDLKIIYES